MPERRRADRARHASAAAGAYIALFVLIGAAVQRAALWSLAIVLLGERLLGDALAGIAQLSPQWLARTAYAGLGPDADDLAPRRRALRRRRPRAPRHRHRRRASCWRVRRVRRRSWRARGRLTRLSDLFS